MEGEGIAPDSCVVERHFALRFHGQNYALDVPAPAGPIDAAAVQAMVAAFLARYRERYHHVNTDVAIELDHVRVAVRGPTPRVVLQEIEGGGGAAIRGHRRIYLPERGGFEDCPVYDRYRMRAGATLVGPAIVEENESTVVLGVDAQGQIDRFGNLVVTLPQAAAASVDTAAPLWA